MKILIVTATYPPSVNGVAISTKRSVDALRAAGHTVFVVGPVRTPKNEKNYLSLPVVQIFSLTPKDYPVVLPWLNILNWKKLTKTRWDIVHVHHPAYVGLLAQRIARKTKSPVVFTYHTRYDDALRAHMPFVPGWIHQLLYVVGTKHVIRRMDALIATTQWLKEDLEEKFSGTPSFFVSTAGLPAGRYLRGSSRFWRKRLGLVEDGPYFITVSRLSTEKNVLFLLHAFCAWAKKNKKGQLIVVGDGKQKQSLEDYVRSQHVTDRVKFIGNINNDDVAPWLNAADVFLYSSLSDTSCISIIEALSAGLPVVALNDQMTRELITIDKNGYLCEANASVYSRLMNAAYANKNRLSKGALQSSATYSMDRTTKHLIRAYEQIIQKHKQL